MKPSIPGSACLARLASPLGFPALILCVALSSACGAKSDGSDVPAPSDTEGAEVPAPSDTEGADVPAPGDVEGSDVPAAGDVEGSDVPAPSDTEGADVPDVCPAPPPGPHARLCEIGCDGPESCGDGNMCLQFQDIGQFFCATPCTGVPPSCPFGFYCADVSGKSMCVPSSGDCRTALLGVDCNALESDLAGLCKNDYPVCTSTDWRPGYCTAACDTDADCPGAFRRCLPTPDPCLPPKVCRAAWESGPEGCGVVSGDSAGNGSSCRDDDDCMPDQDCVKPPFEQKLRPFCAAACNLDGDCPAGTVCEDVAGSKRCIPPSCQCLLSNGSLYDQVLEALELPRCKAMFRRDWLMLFPYALSHDPWRLRHFHDLHDFPEAALPAASDDVAGLVAKKGPERVVEAIRKSMTLIERTEDYSFLPAEAPDGPADAVATFILAAGGTPDSAKLSLALAPLPSELAPAFTDIVTAMTGAVYARKQASKTLGDTELEKYLFDLTHGFVAIPKSKLGLPAGNKDVQKALLGKFDVGLIGSAAIVLAETVEAAFDKGQLAPDAKYTGFSIKIDTPAGLILVGDNGDTTWDAQELGTSEIALLIDTGGNDTYRIPAGANATLDNPVSILIDLSGKDDYGYVEAAPALDPLLLPEDEDGRYTPKKPPNEDNGPFSLSDRNRQGSGRLGVGMLYDLGSDVDHYASLRLSQGFGVLGVGVLYDAGGDDFYDAEAASQGAGIFGIGILADDGGDDLYTAFQCVQGFAYAYAVGILLDQAGNDGYTARLGDPAMGGYPLYYNPQNPGKSNTSMSQGFGFGRRADMTDGVFMSGGFGILVDQAGDDVYQADIFGQGGGYWFGTGILADQGGSDSYSGRWYVQGAAAHYATGILLEGSGDDLYNPDPSIPLLNASVGLGHDWSLGILHDKAGNDDYRAPSLAVGAGNADGLGFLVDGQGDDSWWSSANNTFGHANAGDYAKYPVFETFPCIGIFLDGGGQDAYERPDMTTVLLEDDSVWVNPAPNSLPDIEKGGGADGNGAPVGFAGL